MGTSAKPDLAARYRAFHDLVRVPMGGGHEIVYAPLDRTAHVLSPERLSLLLSCRGFATLDEHAARASGTASASARQRLEDLARAGLLVPESKLALLLEPAHDDPSPPKISTLAIPTSNRPDALRAALVSYLDNAERHGRRLDCVVVDDGTTEGDRDRTRAIAASQANTKKTNLLYAGRAEIARHVAALAHHSGISSVVIAFALEGQEGCRGVGKSRNAILLQAAGELFVQVDDDTRCEITRAPNADDSIALTSNPEPSELWFSDTDAPSEELNFCALHEELLGARVGACTHGRALELQQAAGMFFRRLRDSEGGRVLSTQLGANGDSGTGSMFHLLVTTGASRAHLLASESVYRHAIGSRKALRAAPRRSIAEGGFCMGMALGLDNRDLLPPFFPVLRNSDGVFGLALKVCAQEGYSGFLPFAVKHEPPDSRTSSIEEVIADVSRLTCGDIVGQLILGSRVEAGPDRAANMRSLGAVLERWGSLPQADFEEIARLSILRARGRDLTLLDELLRASGRQPAYWARDVERVAVAMVEGAVRANVAYPSDLVTALGEEAGRAMFQSLVRRYGELLRHWPDIVQASKELRARGERLATSLSE